jgi:hypothetical protein
VNGDDTQARLERMHASMEETYADIWQRYDEAVEAGNYAEVERIEEEADPYSVGIVRTVEILLAGGGPDFRLYAELNADNEVSDVYTIARWGGPKVRTEVYPDSALWRLAEVEAERAVL